MEKTTTDYRYLDKIRKWINTNFEIDKNKRRICNKGLTGHSFKLCWHLWTVGCAVWERYTVATRSSVFHIENFSSFFFSFRFQAINPLMVIRTDASNVKLFRSIRPKSRDRKRFSVSSLRYGRRRMNAHFFPIKYSSGRIHLICTWNDSHSECISCAKSVNFSVGNGGNDQFNDWQPLTSNNQYQSIYRSSLIVSNFVEFF